MAEARARALQMAAEAAEIAAEEAETLQRAARRKAEEQEKMERERVAVCQHQTPEKGQKCSTNYIPTSPELYRYRHNLHRWLLLSMYNYEALRSEDDDDSDLVQPRDEYASDYTSDSN
ncbi:hypothetical protein Vi05172_g4174 [Venturia inaequalis]|nr:hypothetical protein EG327_005275 [Venturia inaequalis]RDI86037.1 hypothetical protein Vi05172_g4174 [Venturia inaequalis]